MNKRTPDFIQLVQKTDKFGYLDQLKTITNGLGGNKYFETFQRKKASSFYAKKIVKPFRLIDQPQYRNERNYQKNFSAYMSSLPQFQSLQKTQKSRPVQKLDKKVQRQAYQNVLTVKLTSDICPEKIKYRKNMYTTANKSSYSRGSPSNFFTQAKINTEQNQQSPKINNISPYKLQTRRKANVQISVKRPHLRLNSKSPRSNFTISNADSTQKINTMRKMLIDENFALQNLNKLQNTDFKQRNFRMQKNKLHEILSKRYGQDIIANFFAMQINQDFQGIVNLVTQIYRSSNKLARILTFLTFDYNQDGFISEDDLTYLNNFISPDSKITEDINTIIIYTKNMNNMTETALDLPLSFIASPTLKQYLRINNLIKTRNEQKMRGALRHYCFKEDDEIDEQQKLPIVRNKRSTKMQQNRQLTNKKYFKLNFEQFEAAFQLSQYKRPRFIDDLIEFMIGKQGKILFKQVKDTKNIEQITTAKKKSKINRNFSQVRAQNIGSLPNSPQRKKRMNSIIQKLKEHNQYLSTIRIE